MALLKQDWNITHSLSLSLPFFWDVVKESFHSLKRGHSD